LRELERAIILLLLSDEQPTRCSSVQLAVELDADAETLEEALAHLARAGVVFLDGSDVWPSPAARHIDELGLIGI
jgi:hypothetical protein